MVRLALTEAALGVMLLVIALTVSSGEARAGMIVGGLVFLGVALIGFAVQWHFRGRTVRVDAREHYLGRRNQAK